MAGTERRSLQFISLYLVAALFFGISPGTTRFFFPNIGGELQRLVLYYLPWVILLMVLILWDRQSGSGSPRLPAVPPVWATFVNFTLFLIISYPLFIFAFTGSFNLPIFKFTSFVLELWISFTENFIALTLLPTVLHWGTGTGTTTSGKLFRVKDYTVEYNVPTANRLKYGLPAIALVALVHIGSYVSQAGTWAELSTSLFIAFIMFFLFYAIKETIGFGASVSTHASFNLALSAAVGGLRW